MGWTEYYGGPRNRAEAKAEIERMVTWENEHFTVRPVKIANHGSTWYVAARFTPKPGGHVPCEDRYVADSDGSHVVALVFLTSRRDGNWGYKDMDEGCGPVESKAPESLLNVLSPLKGDGDSVTWARQWRERCRAYAKAAKKRRRIKDGDVVKLAKPVRFTDGVERDTFKADSYRYRGRTQRIWQTVPSNGGVYRLRADHLDGAEVIPA